jgi:hypothetical protein
MKTTKEPSVDELLEVDRARREREKLEVRAAEVASMRRAAANGARAASEDIARTEAAIAETNAAVAALQRALDAILAIPEGALARVSQPAKRDAATGFTRTVATAEVAPALTYAIGRAPERIATLQAQLAAATARLADCEAFLGAA